MTKCAREVIISRLVAAFFSRRHLPYDNFLKGLQALPDSSIAFIFDQLDFGISAKQLEHVLE
jgi:hypothetical protein